jgi:hypothetical protein
MNPLAELVEVMPPPKRPLHAEGDWEAVEAAMGLRLPTDYKAYIRTYGSGMVNSCLDIPSPLRPGENVRRWWTSWAEFYSDIAEYVHTPYPVFPQPGGLLPFGTLGDVDILNWLTVGEPEQWPFVYYDREKGFFEIKGLSSVEFVLEAVTRRSPLLIQLGSVSVFDPPCDFIAHAARPQRIDLIHPRSVELDALVEQLARHWPADDVRVRKKPTGVSLLVELLGGSINLSQDCGDERTLCCIHYDQGCVSQVEDLAGELLKAGFAEVSRM